MKKNLDQLYFGSLVPVIELNDIIQAYNNGIESSISEAKHSVVSTTDTQEKLLSSQNSILEKWRSYTSHYKAKDEIAYVDFTNKEIEKSLAFISKVIEITNEQQSVESISMKKIHAHVNQMQLTLEKLIAYEIDVAHFERQSLLTTYSNTLFQIALILLFIIVSISVITIGVFKGIQTQQEYLEETTDKLQDVNKQLEEASYTDELTTLNNRRFFNIIYDRELKKAKREKNTLTFMMIDIDYFKLYNDTYGHLAGDDVLHSVAVALKGALKRPSDYIFRLGGEEFGILITNTDSASCEHISELLCNSIEKLEIVHEKNSASDFVTISLGAITIIPNLDLAEQVLISKADENLYIAKEEGRNRAIYSTSL